MRLRSISWLSLLLGFATLLLIPPNGMAQKAVGPVLRITPNPLRFDSALCRVRWCQPITFSNIGDTALVVHNLDKIQRPFYARVDTPFTLQPGESRSFEYCYTPLTWGKDSQFVKLRADSRVSMSIGMLFDVSFSMILRMPDGKQRIEATNLAGREFVGYLLDTLGIEDDAAVYTFDIDENFKRIQTFTKDTALLRAAIPAVVTGTATCTYDAVSRVIDSLRTQAKARFIVVLTDGDDSGPVTCGPATVEQVINKAKQYNTRIYTISIGTVDHSALAQIAQATGGEYFNATTSVDLLSIYRQIATELSKNNVLDFSTAGSAVGHRIEIEPMTLDFDSVQVGQTRCLPITVRNGGNLPLHADSVRALFKPPYAITDLIPDFILPYQTVPALLCFSPTVPTDYTQPITLLSSPCEVFADTMRVEASSFLLPRELRKYPALSAELGAIDTTMCGTSECFELLLRNTGDTLLTVYDVDEPAPPFYGSVATPFTIAPGGTRAITVCYRPEVAPAHDTLHLGFEADQRPRQHVALLFDEGQSMGVDFLPGVTRLTAAIAGANDFLDGLLLGAASPDRASVLRFTGRDTLRVSPFVSDRALLRAALSDTVRKASRSCVFSALQQSIPLVATEDEDRSIVLFTAGVDAGAACGTATPEAVAALAAAAHVRVHVLQLGPADSSALALVAQGSGGRYHRSTDLYDLILTLRDIDASVVGRARSEFTLVGHAVTPLVAVSPQALDFGSNDTGKAVLRNIMLRNYGNAALRIPTATGLRPPFYFDCSQLPGANGILPDTLVIQPGDSLEVCVGFHPARHGTVSDTLPLAHNGCMQAALRIPLNGRGVEKRDERWNLPGTLASATEIDLGRVQCNSTHCEELRFDNPGGLSSLLRITRPPRPPFSVRPEDSLWIPAGAFDEVEICYTPDGSRLDSDTLGVEFLDRQEYGVVLLLARDISMNRLLPDGITAGDASLAAMDALILNLDAAADRVVVYDVDGQGLRFVQERRAGVIVRGGAPSREFAGVHADFPAMLRIAVDSAALLGGDRSVLLLASDVSSTQAMDATALGQHARDAGVRMIHLLAAPSGADVLQAHAGTLWNYAEYQSMAQQSRELHEHLYRGLRVNERRIVLRGQGTAPMLSMQPVSLDFGELRIGGERCLPLMLRNLGDAPLRVRAIINPGQSVPVELPDDIAPGDSAEVDLCFEPTIIGPQQGDVLIVYESCPEDTARVRFKVLGVDSVTVGIRGAWHGKPGSVVQLPLRLFGDIPEQYFVNTFEVEVRCNKTMLYPLPPSEPLENSLAGGMTPDRVSITVSMIGDEAIARYRITGTRPLINPVQDSVLLRLPFLVLLGDSLHTDVRVTDIRFNNGSPRAGVAVYGSFHVDSLCYLEQRLLDASERRLAKFLGVAPNPFTDRTTVRFALARDAVVRLVVHNAMGMEVAELHNGPLAAGEYQRLFDAASLPSGVYLCLLHCEGSMQSIRFILSK